MATAENLAQLDFKAPLRNCWYHVMPSHRLKPGKMIGRVILGEPVVVGRTHDGKAFALRDICPHRALPLSCGRFDGQEITCSYHGWRFAPNGRCTLIPTLVEGQDFDVSKVRTAAYVLREQQGNIWMWNGVPRETYPEIPDIPEVGGTPMRVDITMDFPCDVDEAVISFMDPAHGPFIHNSWWYRSRRPPYVKSKLYTPQPFGFRMERFASQANGIAYRLLGGGVSTEITFRLPTFRIEHLKAGKYTLCSLTTTTPTTPGHCDIFQSYYWNFPWLTPLAPVIKHYSKLFLRQDHKAVAQQTSALKYNPPMLLVDDADIPAKWYYRLKREFVRAENEGRPFVNPLKERVLRYKT
jgi:phenylpropionate dioxygenase-like ring-hydroxylating dioxygenase large terminal subunit